MHSAYSKALLLLMSIAIAAIVVEAVLECREYWDGAQQDLRLAPFYSRALYSSSGARLSQRGGALKLRLEPYLGYGNLPDQHMVHFSINHDGFRGAEIQRLADGKKRIIVIGGSAAFGSGLPGDDYTFAHRLEGLLQNVEVINAGVEGYASGQEYVLALTKLLAYKPDLIIAFDGWNDFHYFVLGMTPGAEEGAGQAFAQFQLQLVSLTRLTQLNVPRRVAANLLNAFFPSLTARLEQVLVSRNRSAAAAAQKIQQVDRIVDSYSEHMLRLGTVLRAEGCRLLCFIQPDLNAIRVQQGQVLTDRALQEFAAGYNLFRIKVRERMLSGGACIDLNEYGDRLSANLFLDSIHPNEAGHQVIAEIINEVIRQTRVL
jgi:lysophospholipase L1-like esterase